MRVILKHLAVQDVVKLALSPKAVRTNDSILDGILQVFASDEVPRASALHSLLRSLRIDWMCGGLDEALTLEAEA